MAAPGPICVAEIQGAELSIKNDALQRILTSSDVKGRPLSIISIAGARHSGKSFMMNFFLQYLQNKGWENQNWFGDKGSKVTGGFPTKRENQACTKGINVWSKIFHVPLSDGREAAVLLVDTQGLVDSDTSTGRKIMSACTLLCSHQILNIMKQVADGDLEHLQFCIDFAKAAANFKGNSSSGLLQNLMFLVRDWATNSEYGYSNRNYLTTLHSGSSGVENIKGSLSGAFDKTGWFFLPQPGRKVPLSDGKNLSNADMEENFRNFTKALVEKVLHPSEIVIKKTLDGREATTEDLLSLMSAVGDAYKSGQLPKADILLKAAVQASDTRAVTSAIQEYNKTMKQRCQEVISEKEILTFNDEACLAAELVLGREMKSDKKTEFLNQLRKECSVALASFRELNEMKRAQECAHKISDKFLEVAGKYSGEYWTDVSRVLSETKTTSLAKYVQEMRSISEREFVKENKRTLEDNLDDMISKANLKNKQWEANNNKVYASAKAEYGKVMKQQFDEMMHEEVLLTCHEEVCHAAEEILRSEAKFGEEKMKLQFLTRLKKECDDIFPSFKAQVKPKKRRKKRDMATMKSDSSVRHDDDIDVQALVEEIDKNISCEVSTVEAIDKDGGPIELQGCSAEFPPDAFSEKTHVSVAVGSSNDDVPAQYVSISPGIRCDASGKTPSRPVTMKLPTYYDDLNGETVILHRKGARDKWAELEGVVGEEGKFVIFKVSHFSHFIGAVRTGAFRAKIRMQNWLFYKLPSQLAVLTCIDEKGIQETCVQNMEASGFTRTNVLPTIVVLDVKQKFRCSMKANMRDTNPNDVNHYPEDIAEERYRIDFLMINPRPKPGEFVSVEYKLWRGANSRPQVSALPLNWPADNSEETEPDVTRDVLHIRVKNASVEAYRKHLGKKRKYQILSDRPKGKVLIINNYFQGEKGERKGSDVDVRNMENLWIALGFENIVKECNIGAQKMLETCERFAKEITNVSALVIIIMSHGGNQKSGDNSEYFCGEDGDILPVHKVVAAFDRKRSPHLKDVPKVFLFQACRGLELQYQYDATPTTTNESLPVIDDMIIAFPSSPGYKALRDEENGSVLMNAITNVFAKYAYKNHVADMLTIVNAKVAKRLQGKGPKQSSIQGTSLKKKLYLFPGWPEK